MVWVSDPGVETGSDPASGVKAVQLLLGRVLLDEVTDSGRDDVRVRLQLSIQGVQEVMSITRVELPGVFAIERHHRQEVLVVLLLADPLQSRDHVPRGVRG